MSWKYELTGDAREIEFPIPGTGELVSLKKGKPVELDVRLTQLPAEVKVTEVKAKKGDQADEEEGE